MASNFYRTAREHGVFLRDVATRHGLTLDAAEAHVNAIWAGRHGSVDKLPVIREAWEVLPGSFSYFDAARAMAFALRG